MCALRLLNSIHPATLSLVVVCGGGGILLPLSLARPSVRPLPALSPVAL